jgi:hypothetical protein
VVGPRRWRLVVRAEGRIAVCSHWGAALGCKKAAHGVFSECGSSGSCKTDTDPRCCRPVVCVSLCSFRTGSHTDLSFMHHSWHCFVTLRTLSLPNQQPGDTALSVGCVLLLAHSPCKPPSCSNTTQINRQQRRTTCLQTQLHTQPQYSHSRAVQEHACPTPAACAHTRRCTAPTPVTLISACNNLRPQPAPKAPCPAQHPALLQHLLHCCC